MGSRQEVIDAFWALKNENRLSASFIAEVCGSLPALVTDPALVREAVAVLCEVAALPDAEFRNMAQRAIFGSIAEPLGDSFEPANVGIYDRTFAQIIDDCRHRPGGDRLDEALRRFNIHSEQDLLRRKTGLRSLTSITREAVKKAFVISRVTLGADVAVSSLMIQAAVTAFPNALITFIAPEGTRALFSETPRFRTLPLTYPRHGTLLDRFESWVELVRVLDQERAGLSAGECIVVDPDSRLTQLGLLPLTDRENEYLFFNSRSYRSSGPSGTERLGQLADQWCREVFGPQDEAFPFVRLAPEKTSLGKSCSAVLRTRGRKVVVSFNFGFGANEAKQLGSEFEVQAVLQALDRGCAVVLDKGIGPERDRANLIVARIRATGRKVVELKSGSVEWPLDVDAIAWEGDAAGFAGLIASTDLYIGYDSAFQHIAAALGVRVIDIFAHTDNERFIERWTPHSRAAVRVLKVAGGDKAAALREIDNSIRALNSPRL